jgi:thiosulfate dehydrogenase [quinone] large subunit
MSTRNVLDTEIFGQSVEWPYSESSVGYALLALRVVMGWILLQGGLTKVVTYLDSNTGNDWSAAGYLDPNTPFGVTAANPLADLFAGLSGNALIDVLNMWGLTLTGLALIIGAFVRFSAFWGAVMMSFYWLAALQGGLLAGLPLEHGWVVDDHVVYAFLLFGLGAFGAGRILGVDAWLERTEVVRNNRWLRWLLG